MADREDFEPPELDDQSIDVGTDDPPAKPLSMKGSFGTALGAAMLGFEQALRREPPAEVLAAEHVPERGLSGEAGGLIIEFPDATDELPEVSPESAAQRRRRDPDPPRRGTSLKSR